MLKLNSIRSLKPGRSQFKPARSNGHIQIQCSLTYCFLPNLRSKLSVMFQFLMSQNIAPWTV